MDRFSYFTDQPGLLFVAATLLPLASFTVLLLGGGLRLFLRARKNESPVAFGLYRLLGGDSPGPSAAYVATVAIAGAFVLCACAFFPFLRDHDKREEYEKDIRTLVAKTDHAKGQELKDINRDIHFTEEKIQSLDERWQGQIDWARVLPARLSDPDRGTILRLGFRIDSLALIMFLMVTLIASLIHLFSIGYMADELKPEVEDHQVHGEHGHLHRRGRFGRFFLFLSLFCFSMLNLILADNLFQVFLSWELVGLCSYLLIGFYYERRSASNAANKAFITNRIGDAGFIIGLLILWTFVGTLNFEDVFKQVRAPALDAHNERVPVAAQIVRADEIDTTGEIKQLTIAPKGSQVVLFPVEGHIHAKSLAAGKSLKAMDNPTKSQFGSMPYWMLVVAGLGIFLGCVGKSAQFPLQVWLPDAMEGPTPVSALIHAATMVAAGVYLVGRCFPLFTPEARLIIAYTGGITLFVAATIAIVMTDIKKVLAYSTVSQLGYMMLALGVGGWVAGLFHLLTHAFFKALLFLGSGSVIYGCHHEQEMTKMGGLFPKMKITALTMLVGVLTIAGTPFFSGWYSKDAILAQALGFGLVNPSHFLLFILPLLTAGITTFYMFRMWFMTFTGRPRDEHVHEHAHESPWLMTVPLIVLAFFSITVAWGWPLHDAHQSYLGKMLHHTQPAHVIAEFGLESEEEQLAGGYEEAQLKSDLKRERALAHHFHGLAEALAMLAMGLGIVFASLLYYFPVLDPAEAKAQFPGIHRFLWSKWRFDELYSAVLVRPSLTVAHWCRAFDTNVIDGLINFLGRFTVLVSKWDGLFDFAIVDGLVNLTARVVYATGAWLRGSQTGFIRSYVLFLVLAAIGIFAVLSYFVAMASAG